MLCLRGRASLGQIERQAHRIESRHSASLEPTLLHHIPGNKNEGWETQTESILNFPFPQGEQLSNSSSDLLVREAAWLRRAAYEQW